MDAQLNKNLHLFLILDHYDHYYTMTSEQF